ncbi:uncharacterized protein LOC142628541 [Castanea sativa]|uniref:uncharacterized protein LOC142628541 n=1 Tax=Castanea sativa TaxID=21020 RepID=UPI003F6535DF
MEYEAILTGLKIALTLGAKTALLKSDSQLVIGQVNKDFKAKKSRMQRYLKLTNQLIGKFDRVKFAQIPRDQNVVADEVARSASSNDQAKMTNWRLEEQKSPNIEKFQTFPVHINTSWMNPILSYLKDGWLPLNPDEAKKIKKQAARFTVLNDKLYKRGFLQPDLRHVEEEEAKYILEDVYEGVYGDHMGAKSLVRKIMRKGYF